MGLARTKHLGAFYTPQSIAEVLARWGVRSASDVILEPSAGSGALIKAVMQRAGEIFTEPRLSVYAFDIDPYAIESICQLDYRDINVKLGDFLTQPASTQKKVDFIIANPPFIRNHSLEKDVRAKIRSEFNAPPSAGIWASFIIHSLSFLKPGGRMAYIVPRSVFFTNHGKKILNWICSKFSNVGVYSFTERPKWSTHADESGAVIFAEGFGAGNSDAYITGFISDDGIPTARKERHSDEFTRISAHCMQLGDLAKVSIGAVTGRNKLFLFSQEEIKTSGIDHSNFIPTLSRARHAIGTKVTRNDLMLLAKSGEKTWLLHPKTLTPEIIAHFDSVSSEELKSVSWFRKRDPWWRVQVDDGYDGVLTYMNDATPRIAILEKGVICTNTLHRLRFKEGITESLKLSTTLSILSTFGQVAAEKIGRSYGGGVLKFEISEARSLPVLCNRIEFNIAIYQEIDRLMRKNQKEQARNLIDKFFMPKIFGTKWIRAQRELNDELQTLRQLRLKNSSQG